MVNVGWVNRWGSLPYSILRVKGDLEIWLSALLIASFPEIFGRWIFISALMIDILIIRERLTRRSPWFAFVTTILFIVNRGVRIKGSSLSPFMAQLSFWMINFQLQGPGIFPMRKVARISGLNPASVGGMHINLTIPSSFKIDKEVFALGPYRFCIVWTWTYHSCTSDSL